MKKVFILERGKVDTQEGKVLCSFQMSACFAGEYPFFLDELFL